jgi:hypothetical protein
MTNSSSTIRDVPLGQPRIRWADLDEGNTRYDRDVAAPSADDLVTMWTVESIIFAFNSIIIATVFLAIVLSRKTRRNPFNTYLLFLMAPDFVFGFLCMLACSLSASTGEYFASWMCRFQSWFIVCGLSINSWLNAVISYEIHRMLKASQIRKRYFPPATKIVVRNSLLVYASCAFLGTWTLLGDWLPIDTDAQFGYFCKQHGLR